MATNGTPSYGSANATEMSGGSAAPSNSSLSKDQVGWYFVEQYYTTLSKTPEKLHLFYNKRSQLVYGKEAEITGVSVGRQLIQERIKKLEFQDCKVRISNVDSQSTVHGDLESIVIQVIGEMSNKGEDSKKFVQTFVLAQQPSGYFVLNDILRYIDEEEDEVSETPAQDADVSAAATTTTTTEDQEQTATKDEEVVDAGKLDADTVDKKLEEVTAEDAEPAAVAKEPETAEVEVPEATKEQTAPKAETTAAATETDNVEKEIAEEEVKKPEAPKDPSPTPAPAPAAARAPAPAPAEPEKPKQPAQPAKPMTWASRVASTAGPTRPAVPVAKAATPAAAPTPRAPAPSGAKAAQQTPAAAKPAEATASQDAGEWQTAGNENKRQARPQSISGPPQEDKGTLGYLKYVSDKVGAEELKAALGKHGEVVYFDINRAKNCAFVEFKSSAGYQAAANANPHTVNGEEIQLEPRRPKANAFGGSNFAPGRGNMSGRGRGGFDGGRGGNQGRGGFGQNRGRGGPGGAPRGRGTAQPTNA